MTKREYEQLQEDISKLYESTKYKGYNSKEREGARKFCLAVKSKLKERYERESNR